MASPQVEQWRPLVSRYFRPEDVEKALYVIEHESGGNPTILGDGGHAIGLFQHNDGGLASGRSLDALRDPEANIRLAAEAVYGGQGWKPWGENNTYQGQPFGALGNNPYPYPVSPTLNRVTVQPPEEGTTMGPPLTPEEQALLDLAGVGGTVAPAQAPLRPKPGLQSVTDLMAIPGSTRQGAVILVPSSTGGGYYDRYEIDPYFPESAAYGTSFKPAVAPGALSDAPTIQRGAGGLLFDSSGGGQIIAGKVVGNSIVPQNGYTIVNGVWKKPGGSTGSVAAADGTTAAPGTAPSTGGTSTGTSPGYATGPGSVTGIANPTSLSGEYALNDPTTSLNEADVDFLDMQQTAWDAGLTSSRSSSKSPDKVTFYNPQRSGSRNQKYGETASKYAEGAARVKALSGATASAAGYVPSDERKASIARYRGEPVEMKNGGSVQYGNGPRLMDNNTIQTNGPADVYDRASGQRLAEISEYGQPELLDFPQPGRMDVIPMERGGRVENRDDGRDRGGRDRRRADWWMRGRDEQGRGGRDGGWGGGMPRYGVPWWRQGGPTAWPQGWEAWQGFTGGNSWNPGRPTFGWWPGHGGGPRDPYGDWAERFRESRGRGPWPRRMASGGSFSSNDGAWDHPERSSDPVQSPERPRYGGGWSSFPNYPQSGGSGSTGSNSNWLYDNPEVAAATRFAADQRATESEDYQYGMAGLRIPQWMDLPLEQGGRPGQLLPLNALPSTPGIRYRYPDIGSMIIQGKNQMALTPPPTSTEDPNQPTSAPDPVDPREQMQEQLNQLYNYLGVLYPQLVSRSRVQSETQLRSGRRGGYRPPLGSGLND